MLYQDPARSGILLLRLETQDVIFQVENNFGLNCTELFFLYLQGVLQRIRGYFGTVPNGKYGAIQTSQVHRGQDFHRFWTANCCWRTYLCSRLKILNLSHDEGILSAQLENNCFHCRYILIQSVKCYPGGRKIHFIPSISEIQLQMWYHCIWYTKRHRISQVTFSPHSGLI